SIDVKGGVKADKGNKNNPSFPCLSVIRTYGKYLMALTKGRLTPFHPEEERFIAVVNGEKAPRDNLEKSWLRFVSEHPEFGGD
ncbi:MAG: DUF413 domain-containing protein, partial [Gammaproteobacteria bacterium]|nr:DUF413 domain-containing protein [Gammaproteobacteria bacterium]